jgi:NADPH-dependent 2,4-dienoyl-CoA reductase/sulfur reductase-like enzyme/rhodanese-related sulfurtransferase
VVGEGAGVRELEGEVVEIDRTRRRVRVRLEAGGAEEWVHYDRLVFGGGVVPVRPKGLEDLERRPRVVVARHTGEDIVAVKEALEQAAARAAEDAALSITSAAAAQQHQQQQQQQDGDGEEGQRKPRPPRIVVLGASFSGLEVAEQARKEGHAVTVIELADQILPQADKAMTLLLETELRRNHVDLILGDSVEGFDFTSAEVTCRLGSGRLIDADVVVVALGSKPDSALAKACGLSVNPRGFIEVLPTLQTVTDENVYACGGVVAARDLVLGDGAPPPCPILASVAVKQGRLVADHIVDPSRPVPAHHQGSLGTQIVKAFDVTLAMTGASEKRLRAVNRKFATVTVCGNDRDASGNASPHPVLVKLLWDPETSRVLGAQATGRVGVDKKIDVLAAALTAKLTIDDLAHLDLAYSPAQFGSLKDVINTAGLAAANLRDGLYEATESLPGDPNVQVVDVRTADHVDYRPFNRLGVLHIPLDELKARAPAELDIARPVVTVCGWGRDAYKASRILSSLGYQCKALNGGLRATIDPYAVDKPPVRNPSDSVDDSILH